MAAPRNYPPMLPVQPVYENKTIRYLLDTLADRVELTPVYQRGIKWSAEAMGGLISCIMQSGIIPPLMFYKLQPGDERSNESYETEVVDGQHRLFVLSHYYHSKMVDLPGKKRFLISMEYKEEDRTITHVFYKETAETVAWQAESGKNVAYMTKEERDVFNGFYLSVAEIRCPLILDQRRTLFTILQQGVAVRGSDLYKNMTDVPLVRFISETKRWEAPMKSALLNHSSLNAQQYWLNWVIRFFLIQAAADLEERSKAYMTTDSRISKMIKKRCVDLNSTPESEAALEKAVMRFFGFIGMLKPGTKLTPTQFFACFTHLLDADEGRDELIATHMKEWAAEGKKAKEDKIWENRGYEDSERQNYFERCLDELERTIVAAQEVEARKTIPKKIREEVWVKAFGEERIGQCTCCEAVIDPDHWEAGHIKPHKFGGKAVLINLTPICRGCNRSMGTQNLWDYKAAYGEGLKQAEALQMARKEAKARALAMAQAGGGS